MWLDIRILAPDLPGVVQLLQHEDAAAPFMCIDLNPPAAGAEVELQVWTARPDVVLRVLGQRPGTVIASRERTWPHGVDR